jgi:hypothetical protein
MSVFMRQYIIFIAIFVLIPALAPTMAYADQTLPIGQIRPLIEWVEARTNTMLLPRPDIYISSEALRRLAHAGDAAHNRAGSERIAAYRDGVIFIDEKFWQPGDIADQSVLIHELVHYAQDRGDRTYACTNQREQEAYRMQNSFLIEHGEQPYIDRAALEHLGQCP